MTSKKLKNIEKKWKTATCNSGAKCWCRLVVTEDCSSKNDKLEDCIACSGTLNKEQAKHFVELHNEWLENMRKYKKKEIKTINPEGIKEVIKEHNKDALFVEEKFDRALMGIGKQCGNTPVAVYDSTKCIEILIKEEGMGELDAYEHYMGTIQNGANKPNFPIFINDFRGMLVPTSKELEEMIRLLGDDK